MILELRRSGTREVLVTSRFSRYTVEADDDTVWLSTLGLEREYLRSEFPPGASLAAIAAFLVTQLESTEIGSI